MLDYSQLAALLAVDETGTYEGAARELNLTSFAVKQRIKTLEAKLGVRLVETSPTRPSKIGHILCDHTREVRALEDTVIAEHRQDCLRDKQIDHQQRALPIAVCDEIFAEWFVDALGELLTMEASPTIEVFVAAKPEIVNLMRSGEVVACLSHTCQDISGFKSYPIGEVTYRAVASPEFIAHHFADGVTQATLSRAPCYRFCSNDDLAYHWIEKVFGKPTKLRIIRYPSSEGSLRACQNGRVWAMHPAFRVKAKIASGDLVELIEEITVKHRLFWHVTGSMTDAIKPITNIVRQSAKSTL